jgi:hypothetical protein
MPGCEQYMGLAASLLPQEEMLRNAFSQPSRSVTKTLPGGLIFLFVMNDVIDFIQIRGPELIPQHLIGEVTTAGFFGINLAVEGDEGGVFFWALFDENLTFLGIVPRASYTGNSTIPETVYTAEIGGVDYPKYTGIKKNGVWWRGPEILNVGNTGKWSYAPLMSSRGCGIRNYNLIHRYIYDYDADNFSSYITINDVDTLLLVDRERFIVNWSRKYPDCITTISVSNLYFGGYFILRTVSGSGVYLSSDLSSIHTWSDGNKLTINGVTYGAGIDLYRITAV